MPKAVTIVLLAVGILACFAEKKADSQDVRGANAQLTSFRYDDFSADSRTQYETFGDVGWEDQQLIFSDEASIAIDFNQSCKAEVALGISWQKDMTDPRVEVRIDTGVEPCMVKIQRGADPRSLDLALVQIFEGREELRQRAVFEANANLQTFAVLIQYRYGMVRVAINDKTLVYRDSICRLEPIRNIGIKMQRGSIENLRVFAGQPQVEVAERFKERLKVAKSKEERAFAAYEQGQFGDATELMESVASDFERIYGSDNIVVAQSFVELAELHRQVGNFERARRLNEDAAGILGIEMGFSHPEYAMLLNDRGLLSLEAGDYRKANVCFQTAARKMKAVRGREDAEYALCVSNLGLLLGTLGDFEGAEQAYTEATEIRLAVLGADHPHYASSLNNLGGLYFEAGEYEQAGPLLRKSTQIRKECYGETHPEYGNSLNNLASFYLKSGDFDEAERHFKLALNLFKKNLPAGHPLIANCQSNLAALYAAVGNAKAAELAGVHAIEIAEKALGPNHPWVGKTLNNLAGAFAKNGDLARAEEYFQRAADVLEVALGSEHPNFASSLSNLGSLLVQREEFERGEGLLLRAQAIQSRNLAEGHPEYADCLLELGTLYLMTGRHQEADALIKKALQWQKGNLERYAAVQSERQQYRQQTNLRKFLDLYLSNAQHLDEPFGATIEQVWRWKGAVTQRQKAYRSVSSDTSLRNAFQELRKVTGELSALEKKMPSKPGRNASDEALGLFQVQLEGWQQRFGALVRKREDLERRIAASNKEFDDAVTGIEMNEIASKLPSGTAFVDFLRYYRTVSDTGQSDARYIACVVRKEAEPELFDIGSAPEIDRTIKEFRSSIVRGSGQLAVSSRLRRLLWTKVEACLDGIETVILSPDSTLGMLPWSGIEGRKEGTFLLEDYRISLIPSASLLKELLSKEARPMSELLLVGDIDYEVSDLSLQEDSPSLAQRSSYSAARAGANVRFKPLAGFANEAEVIKTLFKTKHGESARVLAGGHASEATFLREAVSANVVHIITHGYFADPNDPSRGKRGIDGPLNKVADEALAFRFLPGLLSGLAFAGANSSFREEGEAGDDGILCASEIETASLPRAELVVLSACETGLGAVAGGEGITGLQRAFHIAGARSVVASLWKVDDQATVLLMSEFYRNLWQGRLSKLDALREAQLSMLRGYDPDTGSLERSLGKVSVEADASNSATTEIAGSRLQPKFWAAFQLSGGWR